MPADHLRLGTRSSPLARWQADWVAAQLQTRGVAVQMVHITTQGDVKAGPLGQIGGQGLFTKEIQRSLLAGAVDLAVHSLKDLPTATVEGLALAAVPPRENTSDVLIGRTAARLEELPPGARVGTGSPRRRAQLLHFRRDLDLLEIRGNVDTRLRKLDEGEFDAIILAHAGLNRLGLAHRITQVIPPEIMLPAVGQGALGLETRASDAQTRRAIEPLNDPPSHQAVLAERTVLSALRAGCLAPVGVWARVVDDNNLILDAVVLSDDGRQRLFATGSGRLQAAEQLGQQIAAELTDQGALRLIEHARRDS
jgi:hydroxymethylbilane synthase